MGNQMFSYSMVRQLQIKHKKEKIVFDFTNFEHEDSTWINYIEKFDCGNDKHSRINGSYGSMCFNR